MERNNAALLHVYDYQENNGLNSTRERPGKRTRLVIAAARELLKAGQVEQFVLSGGPVLGKSEALSTLATNHLLRTAHIESQSVSTDPFVQVTTSKELKTLRKKALANSWVSTISIGWELHRKRIEILANRILPKGKIQHRVLSAEEVLSTYPSKRNSERYMRIINGIHNSDSEHRWQSYERKILPMMKIPFVPELLDFVAKFYRPKAD